MCAYQLEHLKCFRCLLDLRGDRAKFYRGAIVAYLIAIERIIVNND
jgi:hypothetical protein